MTDRPPTQEPSERAGLRRAWAVFALCLLGTLAALSVGWRNPILDGDHGFRQTQTAISAAYMVGRPPTLAYETPVLGPPWAIPFEFPLFQWTVAALVALFGTPLDQTGRFVSALFFLACLIPANDLLSLRRVRPAHRLLVLGLFAVSPLYLFWSRTFLIESMALFFTLSYLALAAQYRIDGRTATLLAGLLGGSAAALVKPTTLAPAWLLVVCLEALDAWRAARVANARALARALAAALVFGAVPVVLCLAWTAYADALKTANPNAAWLTSAALWQWNFGTAAQRLAPATWQTVTQRTARVIGHPLVLVAGVAALALAGRRLFDVAACLGLFLAAPLLFTNLHYVHEYYGYANGVFLVAAVGFCVVALAERGGAYALGAGCLFLLALSAFATRYVITYYPRQATVDTDVPTLAEYLHVRTVGEDIIVVAGCDWSPEIPYYSGRRALMIPTGHEQRLDDAGACLRSLAGYRLGAVLVRRRPGDDAVLVAAARLADRAGLSRSEPDPAPDVVLFTRPGMARTSSAAPGPSGPAPRGAAPGSPAPAGGTGGSAPGEAGPRS